MALFQKTVRKVPTVLREKLFLGQHGIVKQTIKILLILIGVVGTVVWAEKDVTPIVADKLALNLQFRIENGDIAMLQDRFETTTTPISQLLVTAGLDDLIFLFVRFTFTYTCRDPFSIHPNAFDLCPVSRDELFISYNAVESIYDRLMKEQRIGII